MKAWLTRIVVVIALAVLATGAAVSAQGPRGAGGDIRVPRSDRAKSAKPGNTPPLYSVPKSLSRWCGGGPGPAGTGVK